MTGKHLTTTSRWRRKVLGIPVIWIVGISTTAAAMFIYVLGFQGVVSLGSGDVEYVTTAAPTGDVCTPTYLDSQTLDVQWVGGLPGDTCIIGSVVVRDPGNDNSTDLKLQDVETDNVDLIATLGADCGKLIEAGAATSPALSIDLQVSDTAAQGTVLTMGPGSGLNWVKAVDFDPGACA